MDETPLRDKVVSRCFEVVRRLRADGFDVFDLDKDVLIPLVDIRLVSLVTDAAATFSAATSAFAGIDLRRG